MKKKSLLILPIAFLLSACTITDPSTWFDFLKKKDNSQPDEGEVIDGPDEMHTHATSLNQTPNAPFYLKVDESREISVSLSPSPDLAEEKVFTWTLSGDFIEYSVNQTNTAKVTVTGKKPGTSTLTATNTYNELLTKTFTIKVIEFDESKDYLWEYASADRAQFGYDNTNAKLGTLEGDAMLNGVKWHYVRSNLSSLQSSMGSVGFGKGSAPETHIHLETENVRSVKKFTIEAASANSLAKMTVKVGDTVYMNEVTVPRDSWDVIQTIESELGPSASGKIEIDVYTPEFDSTRTEDETYKKPGAFYLKSILINFNEAIPDKTLTLVKNASDIVSGERYLIVGFAKNKTEGSKYACLDGSLSSGTKDNPKALEDFTLEDSIVVDGNFDKHGFVATINENGKLEFKSDKNIQIGLTNGGGLSTTSSPAITGWDYTFDSETHAIDMNMYDAEETPKLKHFGANDDTGKFSSYASAKGNIFLYKF